MLGFTEVPLSALRFAASGHSTGTIDMAGAISDEPQRYALHARNILLLPRRRAARLSRCAEAGSRGGLWQPYETFSDPHVVPFTVILIFSPTTLTFDELRAS